MPQITTRDGVEIFFHDLGAGPPIMFHHGWPLSADEWDPQILFFLHQGFRVVAHDRRGHGRSSQTTAGHDMDHYADDALAVVEALDLQGVVHVGHSTGGGEVVRLLARHGTGRASKAAILSAVPPLMLQTPANPGGLPVAAFFAAQAMSPAVFRATLVAYFPLLDLYSTPIYWWGGMVTWDTRRIGLIGLPLVVLSNWLGSRHFLRTDPQDFRRFAILLLAGLAALGLLKSVL